MPTRVKLLNAAPAGTVGVGLRLSTGGKPPITIMCAGGYAGAGVNIDVSPDRETVATDAAATWLRDMGEVGGIGVVEATTGELTDLPSGTVAMIKHYVRWIRATTSGGMTGNATVWLETQK